MERIVSSILSTIISSILILSFIVSSHDIIATEEFPEAEAQVQSNVIQQTYGFQQNYDKNNHVAIGDKGSSDDSPDEENLQSLERPQKDINQIATVSDKESSPFNSDSPPKKVKGLSIKAVGDTELRLKWSANKESDFSHYNIYTSTSALFIVTPGVTKPDGISPTNSYLDGGLRPATIYYYKVAAVDNAGNIGAVSRTGHGKTKNINTINTEENSKPPSDSSTSTSSGLKSQEFAGTATRDYTPPTQVAGLIASTQSSTQINLAWKSNTEADFHHYNIYRGTNSGFGVNPRGTPPVGTSTENSFSNTGLNPSTKYYYKVAAVDKAGNIGTLSLERSATTSSSSSSPPPDTAPPAQVTGLTVSVQSSTQLKLTWNSNSEADFNHYNIYRGTSSGFTVNPGVTQPVGTSKANSYYNTGLSPSTKYYYKVAAVDNSGNIGARSSERSATTSVPPDTTPPAQVTGLTVSVQSSTQLKLTWNSNSEADFNHYNIYRGTSSGFTVNPGVTQPVGTSKANSYYNTGLSPSTKYYYKVAAVDNSGNIGARSSERSGTTSGSQNPNLYDDFEGGTYILSDGQKSPNGKWINRYNGFGQVGVKEESNGNNILYEFPQTSKQKGETHASLLLSTQKVSNGIIEFDMRTDKQLRINDPPNTWEAAWVMWRYGDDFHHYYFVLKTNGIEFGKKDTSCHCEEQVFLKTGSSPKLQMGTWTHVKISSIGAHTSIWLNGVLVVDMDDPSYSRTADMSSGFVGLYNEDAAVSFDNISLSPQ